jgi:hypothetical protein
LLLDPEAWGPLRARYEEQRPRRLLALDGGGIRGIITLAILRRIEELLARATGAGAGFRLCDWFDYVAGASTGAIIAAGIARGLSMAELLDFYRTTAPAMFRKRPLLRRTASLYASGPLRSKLREVFGDGDLRPHTLRTLLLVVTRNATTDSPWPVSSNPDAFYNDPARPDCNLRIPLWTLVRASAAAPVFFPPEIIPLEKPEKEFLFMDGGITPYNNPAFLLYRMATQPAYRLNWPPGERRLLLISVGTGAVENLDAGQTRSPNIFVAAKGVPAALLGAMQMDQDINCRSVGRCVAGPVIDRELGDMIPREGPEAGSLEERLSRPAIPLDIDLGRAFLYARYNADLSPRGLDALGCGGLDPAALRRIDNVAPANIESLVHVGEAAARQVNLDHFARFVNR